MASFKRAPRRPSTRQRVGGASPPTLCLVLGLLGAPDASAEPPAYAPTLKRALGERAGWVGRAYTFLAHLVPPAKPLTLTLTCQGTHLTLSPPLPDLDPMASRMLAWFFCHLDPVKPMLAHTGDALLTQERAIGVRDDDFTLSYGTMPQVVITQRRGRLMGMGFLENSPKIPSPSAWQLRADWPLAGGGGDQQGKGRAGAQKKIGEPSRVLITRGGGAFLRLEPAGQGL